MKYNIVYFLLLIFVVLGCKKDHVQEDSGTGWLAVEFLIDRSVQTRGAEPVYKLEIQKTDGTVVNRYDNCSEISERIILPAGIYKIIAFSGEEVLAGFDKPFYKAEQEVKIEAAVTKEISIICTQANVKLTVEYSDLIKNTFPEYSLQVANGEGSLTFEKDETRAGYLQVNEGTLTWNLALDNGQEVHHLNKTITGVEPRQHYHFSFDIKENGNEEEGAFVGGVVVDTTTDVYNWLCEIVLKENIAKPTILRLDNESLKAPVLVLADSRGADIQLEITAQARMQNLTVRHNSALVKEMGVPEVITLTDISQEIQASVNSAGIIWGNTPLLDAQQATINFSGLANKLPLGEYQFYISVYDARNRLVNDTLRISVIPDMEHLAQNVNQYDIWAKFATINGMWYTLEKPAGLTFEYSTDQNTWTKVAESQLSFNEAAKTFSVCLKSLKASTTYYYRTTSDKEASENIKSFVTEEAFQVPYLNFDNWYESSKSYYLGINGETKWWDSGNAGANSQSWLTGVNNPTSPDASVKVDLPGNNNSAKLQTMSVFGVMAAGNLYTGDFVKTVGTSGAKLNFGKPFTSRPTKLTGYYKYQPVAITNTKLSYVKEGDMDSCYIYVALFDSWTNAFEVDNSTSPPKLVDLSKAIALGELKTNRSMSNFEQFEINIQYRDKTKIPTYILIVATASKYGDYFTGGVGSTLWVDEFELGYEPFE